MDLTQTIQHLIRVVQVGAVAGGTTVIVAVLLLAYFTNRRST